MIATTTTPARPTLSAVETRPCHRCGGSGEYGPKTVFNGKCFSCTGTGKLYTKRGLVVRQYLDRLRCVTPFSLVSGQKVRVGSVTPTGEPVLVWVTVKRVTAHEDGTYTVETACGATYHEKADALWRVALTAEEKKETLRRALAFQDTLDANGRPL